MTLNEINKRFTYTSDGNKDTWKVLDGAELKGDCEDYALTVLFNVLAGGGGDEVKFWGLLESGQVFNL